MTQPHLLELANQVELAKQGDPQAIAALMNVTLEPQGVSAKAFVELDCLHVFLSAARPLNAKTLVAFVQRGILRLDVTAIQQVKVYGQRLGEAESAWVETFAVRSQADALALERLSHPSSFNASRSHTSNPATQPNERSTPSATWQQHWMGHKLNAQASLHRGVTTAKQMLTRLPWHDRPLDDRPLNDRPFTEPPDQETANALTNHQSVNYLKLSVLVTLVAFVTGGTVALIANSYTLGGAEQKAGSKPAAIALGSQMAMKANAERLRDQQQTAAKSYLETMNKAQQTFYRQNNRFATTLEELERFAAVPIAVRSDYTYKLTVPKSTQSQLTAIPKADGLKSYTAAASIAQPTSRVVTAICASQQATKVPPLVFQSTNGTVQCPAESAKSS